MGDTNKARLRMVGHWHMTQAVKEEHVWPWVYVRWNVEKVYTSGTAGRPAGRGQPCAIRDSIGHTCLLLPIHLGSGRTEG